MKLPKIENLGFIGIIMFVVLAFFYFILGFSGMMAVLGIILLFVVPLYLILDNFDLGQDEKIVFSFFLGVGISSYYLGLIGLNIKYHAIILPLVLILVGIGANLRNNRI